MSECISLHRIAVISDTHGMLRPEVIEILQSAELILHAGDFAGKSTFDRLAEMKEMRAVRGNCDGGWAEALPEELLLELYGWKIYMIHNIKKMTARAGEADILVCGHSHKYSEKTENGKLWLNPGSCGPRRFGRPVSMAVLEIDTEACSLKVRRIDLAGENDRKLSSEALHPDVQSGDLREAVELVVKDLKKGRTVDEIVKKRGLSGELTEQICQIYFTHPGIDEQGILNRIEIAGK